MTVLPKFEPEIRKTNGMLIYFRDKHTTIVSQGYTCIAFHRWFDRPKGNYPRWFNFCRVLKRRNTINDIYEVCKIANHYGIDCHHVTNSIKTLPPKGIKEIPSLYEWQ